jgi:membrane protease YdiL (CAAX protease family)
LIPLALRGVESFKQKIGARTAKSLLAGAPVDPEVDPPLSPTPPTQPAAEFGQFAQIPSPSTGTSPSAQPEPYRGLRWIFIGSHGLRAGWSVAIFLALLLCFIRIVGAVLVTLFPVLKKQDFSPGSAALTELIPLLAMLGAAAILALIERRSILDYNLKGPRRVSHFAGGLVAGFAALSALIAALVWGGWLHFGSPALSGPEIFIDAALWGLAFVLVGCVEEGIFRCYLLSTLTRGINFWWAVCLVLAMCVDLLSRVKGNGVWGVYGLALLGLCPCLMLLLRKTAGAGFWYAAWVTSTFFGYIHTSNNGENWIGIFAAGAIGFVFCVSVKVTGSAWWAIGCHMAWDWAETYFYGTADSGLVAKGHYLSASPAGAAFWSGGTDGPEGSVLVLGVISLLLAAVLVLYGRGTRDSLPALALDHAADRVAG